jgi:dipeptidyl aminopeptidase/acylaminoacyl peptidase
MKKSRLIPVEKFCKNPDMWAVRLSPDGNSISFLRPVRDHRNIFLQPVGANCAKQVTREENRDVTSYFWKTDRYLIYLAGTDAYRVDLARGDIQRIRGKKEDDQFLSTLNGISRDEILVARCRSNVSDVYRFNICTGEFRKVFTHPDPREFGIVQQWIIDNAGDVRAAISVKGTKDHLLARADVESPFKIARTMDFRRSIEDQFYSFLFFTADNRGIYAITRTHRRRDKAAVVVLSARNGKEVRCVYQNRSVDVAGFGFSNKRKVITHVFFHDSKLRNKVLDRETERIFKTLASLPRDYVVELVSRDIEEKKFIVRAQSDRMQGKYYLLDTSNGDKHTLTLLGEEAPWLNEKDLAPAVPIRFKARDGLTIQGYRILPRGSKKKKLPLILHVHGGPDNRNYWQYDPLYGEVQLLANRGYAVLQLNFRGSAGYGRSFWTKGFRQRGRKMQDDVTDAVRWAIKKGFADPTRIVIFGKSYGGYAALAGVAFSPNLYQAAIDYGGVSNWLEWLKWLKKCWPEDPLLPQEYVKTGDPETDRQWLEAVAPTRHADRINKPVLIVHAECDTQVPKAESERMLAALKGKDVQYVPIPNDGHILAKEESKITFCNAVMKFLAKHLR